MYSKINIRTTSHKSVHITTDPPPCRYPPPLVFWDFEIFEKLNKIWQWNLIFCCRSQRKGRKKSLILSSIIFLFTIRDTKNIISIWNCIYRGCSITLPPAQSRATPGGGPRCVWLFFSPLLTVIFIFVLMIHVVSFYSYVF